MIEKFNNVWYLIIFLVHFLGIGVYAFQTIFQTRKFCTKFEIDDSAFTMIRFVGAFMLANFLMAVYILFIRRNVYTIIKDVFLFYFYIFLKKN